MAAAYSELPGKCLLVLQSASCGQAEGSGSGGGEVEVVDSRQVGLGEEGYLPAGAAVLRAGLLARTYSSISLAGFTLLSAGSTSEAGTPQVPPGHTPPHITPPCRRLHGGRARGADLQQRRGHPGRHRHQLQQVGHPALPPAHRLEIQVSSMMMMIMMIMMMMMHRSDALNIVGLIALVLVLSQLPRLSSLLSLAPTVKRSENTEHR